MDELEVEISNGSGKAVIEGKTPVPFQTFVSLILQRKVQTLFKKWSDEPVIVGTELLTSLASAPNDRQDDRNKLVLVTFGVGVIGGAFLTIAVFAILMLLDVRPELKDLAIALATIGGVAAVITLLQRGQKRVGFTQQLSESMEKVADLIAR